MIELNSIKWTWNTESIVCPTVNQYYCTDFHFANDTSGANFSIYVCLVDFLSPSCCSHFYKGDDHAVIYSL